MFVKIEANIGERTFLNFWNNINGNDVVVEVVNDSQLIDSEGNTISLSEFLNRVKSSAEESLK